MNTFMKIAIGAGIACTSILGFTIPVSAAPALGVLTSTPKTVTFAPAAGASVVFNVAPGAGAEVQFPGMAGDWLCTDSTTGATPAAGAWTRGFGCWVGSGSPGSAPPLTLAFRAAPGATPGNYIATYTKSIWLGGNVTDTSAYSIAAPADAVTITAASEGPNPTFSGTGEPGATVQVRLADGTLVATATVGPDGTWSGPSTVTLAPQSYTVTASQTVGGVTTTDDLTFTVVAVPIVDPMVAGGAGMVLLVAGAGIYVAKRRRSPASGIA